MIGLFLPEGEAYGVVFYFLIVVYHVLENNKLSKEVKSYNKLYLHTVNGKSYKKPSAKPGNRVPRVKV